MDPLQEPKPPPPPNSPPASPYSDMNSSTLSDMNSSTLSDLQKTLSPIPALSQLPSARYPTPQSSQDSGNSSPAHKRTYDSDSNTDRTRDADGPPAKRRRVAKRPSALKPPKMPGKDSRTTKRLNLRHASRHNDKDEQLCLDQLVHALKHHKKIVVIAGAGISVSAGIPDFRSKQGLFATRGKQLFDASVYKHAASTSDFHEMVRALADVSSKAKPTPFHHMLASIASEGRLLRLYTQNVDGLETSMEPLTTSVPLNHKGPWPRTIQLHGSLEKMYCTKCKEVSDLDPAIFVGSETPDCPSCTEVDRLRTGLAGKRSHGIGRLRPRMVLYNEHNPDEDAIGQVSVSDIKSSPDLVIVVGTTLKIPGVRRMVKQLCSKARGKRNGLAAWINLDPQGPQGIDFKDCFDLVVEGKADDVATIVGLPRWDEETVTFNVDELSPEQRKSEERKLSFDKVEIRLPLVSPMEPSPDIKVLDPRKSASNVAKLCGDGDKPRSKVKQVKLPFGTQAQLSDQSSSVKPKATKESKSKAKKPRPAKQDIKRPKNDITKNFKMTKSVAATTVKSGKPLTLNLSVNVKPLVDSTALPPLRPPRRSLPDSRPPKLSTGGNVLRRLSTETISPTTKPRGMEQLIN